MPKYFYGTSSDDTVTAGEPGVYSDFGLGTDKITAGHFNDTFNLLVDEKTDTIDGGGGEDLVDYSRSDRGLTIDLAHGKVTALFGDGSFASPMHYANVANLISIEDAIGSRFNDTMYAKSASSVLEGGAGADKIYGGVASYAHSAAAVQIDLNYAVQHGGDAQNDQLYNISSVIGSGKDDRLFGHWGGDNTFEGGAGADQIYGGGYASTSLVVNGTVVTNNYHIHTNTASYAHSSAGVQIDLNQTVQHYGDAEGDQLTTIDNVAGSAFGDQITGNDANNHLEGGAGDDTFFHTPGWDWIDGGAGYDTYVVGQVSGTGGVEVFIDFPTDSLQVVTSPSGSLGFTNLIGTFVHFSDGRGNDILTSVESFVGSQNGDTFDARQADPNVGVTIDGDGGDDFIYGSDGSDKLRGGADTDYIQGGKGGDTIYGGSGDDHLFGEDNDDFLYGDENDDWLIGGRGADFLDGGAGFNTADYGSSSAGVTVALERMTGGYYSHYTHFGLGSGGDAEGDQLRSIQQVIGSNHDDTLTGDYLDNVLSGSLGNDTLIGGGGNDRLLGGQGDDTLTGGGGLMAGASDNDTFVFEFFSDSSSANIGNDVITDFQAKIDTLQFAHLSPAQTVHVAQDGADAVITFDHVLGSITLLNAHATDVTWTI